MVHLFDGFQVDCLDLQRAIRTDQPKLTLYFWYAAFELIEHRIGSGHNIRDLIQTETKNETTDQIQCRDKFKKLLEAFLRFEPLKFLSFNKV